MAIDVKVKSSQYRYLNFTYICLCHVLLVDDLSKTVLSS